MSSSKKSRNIKAKTPKPKRQNRRSGVVQGCEIHLKTEKIYGGIIILLTQAYIIGPFRT